MKDSQCELPDGVTSWDLWFDVSPLRPDEWARTEAAPFQRATSIQHAWRQGIEDANAEHEAKKG